MFPINLMSLRFQWFTTRSLYDIYFDKNRYNGHNSIDTCDLFLWLTYNILYSVKFYKNCYSSKGGDTLSCFAPSFNSNINNNKTKKPMQKSLKRCIFN